MLDGIRDWLDENKGRTIGVIIILVLTLLVVSLGAIFYLNPGTDGPDAVMATPDATMLPTSTPGPVNITATPTVTPSPTAEPRNTSEPSYEDLLYYYQHNNNTTYWYNTPTPTATPVMEGDPAYSNGARIYVPTPTPSPTPLPPEDPMSRERHTTLLDMDRKYLPPDSSKDSIQTGTLAIASSEGLYNYYYPGDHAVVRMRVVSNTYTTIVNPTVEIRIKAQAVLGQWVQVQNMAWVETATITPAFGVDSNNGLYRLDSAPGEAVVVHEFDIPSNYNVNGLNLDTNGLYMFEVNVYANNIRACGMTKQVAII